MSKEKETTKKTFKARNNFILVECIPEDVNEKVGSLYIPAPGENANKITTGKVISIGTGMDKSADYEVGMEIVYSRFGGTPYMYDNKQCHLLREQEIMGILS